MPPPPSNAIRRKRFPFAKLGLGLALAGGVGYAGWMYLPTLLTSEGGDVPLTATVARDELKITVSDRGELESIDATTVHCELRGQAKLSTIVPEGTHVKKDSVVAQLDTDQFTKLQNEQRVKWEAAEGKVLACKSDLTQAESKAGTEIAKEAATRILSDDNFATIIRAIERGRGIYENILTFLRFQLTTAFGA
ncbi:MAG: hypothetical protein ABGY75_18390, partial [Gemmataceae bacterium]